MSKAYLYNEIENNKDAMSGGMSAVMARLVALSLEGEPTANGLAAVVSMVAELRRQIEADQVAMSAFAPMFARLSGRIDNNESALGESNADIISRIGVLSETVNATMAQHVVLSTAIARLDQRVELMTGTVAVALASANKHSIDVNAMIGEALSDDVAASKVLALADGSGDTSETVLASDLNAALAGEHIHELSIGLYNAAGKLHDWCHIPEAAGKLVITPAETVVDTDVGVPVVEWMGNAGVGAASFSNGVLALAVKPDVDGGSTKIYASGDLYSITVDISAALLCANVANFQFTWNVI